MCWWRRNWRQERWVRLFDVALNARFLIIWFVCRVIVEAAGAGFSGVVAGGELAAPWP